MSFYICHCGNVPENHNFKHPFENKVLVKRSESTFEIDANSFEELEKTKCRLCSAKKDIHLTPELISKNKEAYVNHLYEPLSYKYRKVNFSVPYDTKCIFIDTIKLKKVICNQTLREHTSLTHVFNCRVNILNKRDTDEINIFDYENSKKISS